MKENKQFIRCPYNKEVQCTDLKCITCGWHPETAERRLRKIRRELQQGKGRADR